MSTVPCYESTAKSFEHQLERERVVADMSALPIAITAERTVPIRAKLPIPAQFCEAKLPIVVNALYDEPSAVRQRRLFLKGFGARRTVRVNPAHRCARAPGRRPVRVRQRSRSASSSHSASASSGSSSDPPADPPSPATLSVEVLA